MEQVLLAREVLVRFCKRYEIFIVFVIKFIIGMFIFSMIREINRPMAMFDSVSSLAAGLPYTMLMSLIFAVTPINAGYLLITLNLVLQTSAVLQVSLLLGIFMLSVQGLYTRLAPQECVLILVMFTAYYFKLPYFVPILAGLYFSMTAIVPIAIAVFMWQFLPLMLGMFQGGEDTVFSVGGLTEVYQTSYTQVVGAVATNHDWVIISFIFAMVVLVVYAISHTSINYSKDIAIALGGAVTVIGFITVTIVTDVRIGIPGMLLSTMGSVALAYVIRFFDVILDYRRVERVQFQDEDNVYYVKIVPKIVLGIEDTSPQLAEDNDDLVRIAGAEPERIRPERRPVGYGSAERPEWAERWERAESERERNANRTLER